MQPSAIGFLVFVCVFSGSLAGLYLHRLLPEMHLTRETQDVIRLGTGMLSVLSSLVLGLLIATAKSSFDKTDDDIRNFAAELILAGQILHDYGPETAGAREDLRRYTAFVLQDNWKGYKRPYHSVENTEAGAWLDSARASLIRLEPATEEQRLLRTEAIQLAGALLRMRWQLIEQQGTTISPIIIAVVVFWIAFIFASFGMNAPRNATVVVAFLVCSWSIGCAFFLVLEMNQPLNGLISVSDQPFRNALEHLSQ